MGGDNEDFMKSSTVFSNLALRVSYALPATRITRQVF